MSIEPCSIPLCRAYKPLFHSPLQSIEPCSIPLCRAYKPLFHSIAGYKPLFHSLGGYEPLFHSLRRELFPLPRPATGYFKIPGTGDHAPGNCCCSRNPRDRPAVMNNQWRDIPDTTTPSLSTAGGSTGVIRKNQTKKRNYSLFKNQGVFRAGTCPAHSG
jgi:hypothetical protein